MKAHSLIILFCIGIGAFFFPSDWLMAQDIEPIAAGHVKAVLTDGSEIRGELVSQDSEQVVIRTGSGAEMKIPRRALVGLKSEDEFNQGSRFDAFDPNYSRLIVMPTARPLRQGACFFSDTWLFFPSVSVGVTNNITMMAGMSLFPFADLSDQLIYVSPKVGAEVSPSLALSVGALYVRIPEDIDELAVGVVYAVGTYGGQDAHFSLGLGWGYYKEEDEDFKFGATPATLIGGFLRTSEISALMFETWYFPSDEYEIKREPFGFVVRLFGERIAVDAGAFTSIESLADGHVVPWLAATYNFGALK